MTRIGTYGAGQMYLSRISEIQQRMNTEQIQVSTGKKSTNYTGVAPDATRIVNLETEQARADKYVTANDFATTKLNAAETSMGAIETEMKNFSQQLDYYLQYKSTNATDIKQLQQFAFQAMQNIQGYLSSNIDGQYIFSGGRVNSEPVKLPTQDFKTFQQLYDGMTTVYPTTRAASLQDVHTTTADTGNLTIDPTTGTITAATAGSLSKIAAGSQVTVGNAGANLGTTFQVAAVDPTGTTVRVSKLLTSAGETGVSIKLPGNPQPTAVAPADYTSMDFSANGDTITLNGPTGTFNSAPFTVGAVFTVSGSASVVDIDGVAKNNDGTYQVESVSGVSPFQITVKSVKPAADVAVPATLNSTSWYQGDNMQLKQKIDDSRQVDIGIYASDPAFDKAFRAMGLIAQGAYGTAGGLENNMQRLDQARALIQDAISRNSSQPGPFGVEQPSDIEALRAQNGTTLSVIQSASDIHKTYSGFIQTRLDSMVTIDKTEAITKLMDDQTSLQASYQALSKVRELSLLQYMK